MPRRAYLEMLVVASLAAACTCAFSPCEAQSGQCTRTDQACGPTQRFAGFDPSCEPNSKCCLPLTDAGTCAQQAGTCHDAGFECPAETRYVLGVCERPADVCCVPYAVACMKKNGHCLSQALRCPASEKDVGGPELCGAGNHCCAQP